MSMETYASFESTIGALRAGAQLDELSRQLWVAHGGGRISDAEAEGLDAAIRLRRLGSDPKPAKRSTGSRARTPASRQRALRWVASGWMPPQVASRFRPMEQAALAVIARQIHTHGCCKLPVGAVAALAGVSETTVRAACRQAAKLGLLAVHERRITKWRSDTNVVEIVSREWRSWLARRPKGGGCKVSYPTKDASRLPYLEQGQCQREVIERHPVRRSFGANRVRGGIVEGSGPGAMDVL